MYKIIGADQKEYGPVTAEQIRQWVAEGRANGQTQVLPDSATEWRALSELPEFRDLLPGAGFAPTGSAAAAPSVLTPEELVNRDYDLDIGSCLTRSWALVKQNFGPVVGITFLVFLIVNGLNQGLALIYRPALRGMILRQEFNLEGCFLVFLVCMLGAPIYSVFMGGLFNYYLKLIRGEPAGIGDAFSAVTLRLGPLALLGLAQGFLTLLGAIACVLPGLYLSVAWFFAVPLVMDKDLGFWEAMELSRKVVTRHWFLVFAMILVAGLVAMCGIFGCCIGIIVTIPIGHVALMYAYEDLFGSSAR